MPPQWVYRRKKRWATGAGWGQHVHWRDHRSTTALWSSTARWPARVLSTLANSGNPTVLAGTGSPGKIVLASGAECHDQARSEATGHHDRTLSASELTVNSGNLQLDLAGTGPTDPLRSTAPPVLPAAAIRPWELVSVNRLGRRHVHSAYRHIADAWSHADIGFRHNRVVRQLAVHLSDAEHSHGKYAEIRARRVQCQSHLDRRRRWRHLGLERHSELVGTTVARPRIRSF